MNKQLQKFALKSPIYAAQVKFDESRISIDELDDIARNIFHGTGYAVHFKQVVFHLPNNRTLIADDGDWVVKFGDGFIVSLSDVIFQRNFERISSVDLTGEPQ